ncbi:hypothetical protein FBU59_000215 [Linderina macrospora]|uniref:Uncharacterized protein n=1 Tax=Linderina macrospora TaxID=4868 RepID=A0ACC1JHG7_9FUNG|nr:hypothetical protein FBU59_000215 [Linderina macrospora]
MGYKYPRYLENDEGKSARASKRRRTIESYVSVSNEQMQNVDSAEVSLFKNPPPAGYDMYFDAWNEKWLHRADRDIIKGDILAAVAAVRHDVDRLQKLEAARGSEVSVSGHGSTDSIELLKRDYERFDKRREMIMARLSDSPDSENLWMEIHKLDIKCESVQKDIDQKIEDTQKTVEAVQKAVEESIERVNKLLAISDGEATNTPATSNLLFGPIELLIAPQNTRPAHRIVNSRLSLPPIQHDTERRQSAIRLNHQLAEMRPHLQLRRFVFPHARIDQGFHPRILLNEHSMGVFFENEVFSRVLEIYPEVIDGASIEFVPGNPVNHADYFAYLKVNVRGKTLHTYVVFEFKMPYRTRPQTTGTAQSLMGDPRIRLDEESAKALEDAGFASVAHGAKLVHQAYCYARDGQLGCPQVPDPRLINRRFGYCSTFNESWVCEYIDDSMEVQNTLTETQCTAISLESSDDMDTAENPVVRSPGQTAPASYIKVSSCFHANNNSPHIAVVIVDMLNDAVNDMKANPDQYMEMDQAVDKTNPLMSPPSRVPKTPYMSGVMTHSVSGKMQRKSLSRRSMSSNGATTREQDMVVLSAECKRQTKLSFQPLFQYTDVHCGNAVANQPAQEQAKMATDSTLQGGQSANSGSATQEIWPYIMDNWRPLAGEFILGRQIGYGRSGYVHEAWYNNCHIALKLCHLQTEDRILEEIVQETLIYDYLKDLQGTVLPIMYDYGIMEISGNLYMALVLEFLKDALQLDTMTVYRERVVSNLPASVKHDIMRSLAKLHERGVVHNDPRVYNVLLVQDPQRPDRYMPKLLDLAMSYGDATAEAIREDKNLWTAVLNGMAN